MKSIFRDRQLSIQLKIRLLKCFVWPVLMYGCETWTVTTKTMKNLEATEMWFYHCTTEFSAFSGQRTKLMCQSFKKWDKSVNCFVVYYRTKTAQIFGPCCTQRRVEDLALSGRIPEKRARGV